MIFTKAKTSIHDLEQTNFLRVTLPWVPLDDVRGLMGEDYWPYGVRANREQLEAVTRCSHDEGLAKRPLAIGDLFHPSTLDT